MNNTPIRKIILSLLCGLTLRAATVTVCDSGCTDVTANLQAVINARACGDRVQLKAQSTAYPPFYLPGGNSLQCGGTPIYVENFVMSSLPPSSNLLTPAYVALLPNVQATSSVLYALVTHNGGADCGGGSNHCPANGWVIQGLAFTEATNRGQNPCFIMLGAFDSTCTADTTNIIVQADMPTNITFQRNYIQTSPYTVTRRCLSIDFYLGTVRDNWIDCISPTLLDPGTGDSQALIGDPVGTSGNHVLVANNMVIGGTEVVTWGSYPALVKTPARAVNGAFGWLDQTTLGAQYIDTVSNHIQHDPYALTVPWVANTWYRIGQSIVSSSGAGPIFIAVSTGKSSGSEPSWAGTGVNSNLTDGTITWRHADNQWGGMDGVTGLLCGYSVKNHWESKSALNIRILNNFLDRLWSQCAAFGNQGRSLVPEIQSQGNGGGAAANVVNVELSNNIATNISAAFGTNFSLTDGDGNRWPRFLGSAIEPYTINAGNQTLKISIDGGTASTITLTTGTRRAKQIADEINAAAMPNLMATPVDILVSDGTIASSCTTSTTTCRLLIQRGSNPNLIQPTFSNDNSPRPWNASGTPISISPATGTTTTSVLGLPANGTIVTACTNPQSLTWYGCGHGSNVSFTNNLFQMRHDGAYQPFVGYIGAVGAGIDGFTLNHNLFTDPSGWYSGLPIGGLILNGIWSGDDTAGHAGEKNMLLENNIFQDHVRYIGATSPVTQLDWSAINYGCQTAAINSGWTTGGDQAAICDGSHTKGGFTKNLSYGIAFTNPGIGPCVPALTCDTNPADSDIGGLAQPNDNFNAIQFSSVQFAQATPGNNASPDYALLNNGQALTQMANYGTDGTPIGVDMDQMNFVRMAAPTVSDRAALFSINNTTPLTGTYGMMTIATDPFCFNPVSDSNPASYTNPGWTGRDTVPIYGTNTQFVVGLNAILSASTPYYYCLEYQGYGLTGSFTTSTTVTGSSLQPISFTASSGSGATELVVQYGTSYSRATDAVGSPSVTAPVCNPAGGACSTSFLAVNGAPAYWRWQLRDAGHAVLVQSNVTALLAAGTPSGYTGSILVGPRKLAGPQSH